MPIVEIEVVDLLEQAGQCQSLARACAVALDSRPAATWVILRALSSDHYAENGPPRRPVFVAVTLAD